MSCTLPDFTKSIEELLVFWECHSSSRNQILYQLNVLIDLFQSLPCYNTPSLVGVISKYLIKTLTDISLSENKFLRFSARKLISLVFDKVPILFTQITLQGSSSSSNLCELTNSLLLVISAKLKHDENKHEQWYLYKDFITKSVDLRLNMLEQLDKKLKCPQTANYKVKSVLLLDIFKGVEIEMKIFKYSYNWFCRQMFKKYVNLITTLTRFVEQLLVFINSSINLSNKQELCFKSHLAVPHLLWFYLFNSLLVVTKCFFYNSNNIRRTVHFDEAENKDIKLELYSSCVNICQLFLNKTTLPADLKVREMTFGGTDCETETWLTWTECTLRKFILFFLYTQLIVHSESKTLDTLELHTGAILACVYKFPNLSQTESNSKALIQVFMEQDDELVEVLLLLLKIHVNLRKQPDVVQEKYDNFINPFTLLYYMLENVSFDDSILLDWLINNESNFQEYFNLYLQFQLDHYELFTQTLNAVKLRTSLDVSSALGTSLHKLSIKAIEQEIETTGLVVYSSSESDESDETVLHSTPIDNIMSCLIRLHYKLKRIAKQQLLPLRFCGILEHLDRLEEIYER